MGKQYKPVPHDLRAFLAKAGVHQGFIECSEALAPEYQFAERWLKARSRAGLTQDDDAERMSTIKSAISRLESAGKPPSLATLKRYAHAVGCEVQVKRVRSKAF